MRWRGGENWCWCSNTVNADHFVLEVANCEWMEPGFLGLAKVCVVSNF